MITVERRSVDPGGVAVEEITVDGCCRGLVAAGEPLERAKGLEESLGIGATVVGSRFNTGREELDRLG